MLRTMRRYKIPPSTTTDMDSIRKCIVSGLFPNAAYLHMSGTYRTGMNCIKIGLPGKLILSKRKGLPDDLFS